MNIRLSILFGFIALATGAVALSQNYPWFPGSETDQRTLRTQEQVEGLYVQGAYDRAYFIYRNELAPRGDKYAQYMIGYMHLTGTGVSEDPAAALAWYRLAAERGEPSIALVRDNLEESLGPAQVAAADALFAELNSELSDRVLVFKLVQKDLELLRDSAARGVSNGGSHMLVIDRRYGHSSGAQHYQLIKNRLGARLRYLKGQVEAVDVQGSPNTMELAQIEIEIKRLIAEIDARR